MNFNKWIMTGIAALMLMTTTAVHAQGPGKRPGGIDIEVAKKRFIENKLDLSDEESDAFWPLYDEHQRNMEKLRNNYEMEENPMFLSDAEAESFLNNMLEFEEKRLDERKRYVGELREVLPVRKVLFLYHLEEQFRKEVMERLRQRMQNRPERPARPPQGRN